jgi:hypothetical protein
MDIDMPTPSSMIRVAHTPRWDRRLRMILDWTVAFFFEPDVTKVELTDATPKP